MFQSCSKSAGVTGRSIFRFRCDAGYTGQHCEKKDYSVLYVVPGPVRFQYVLIAAVIGTIQIAIICVVVLCITRSVSLILCNRKKKGHFFPALCADYRDFCSDTCDNKYHSVHQQQVISPGPTSQSSFIVKTAVLLPF